MKFTRILLPVAIVVILAQCTGTTKKVAIKNDMDTMSYCFGYLNAKSFKERYMIDTINVNAVAMAMQDYSENKKGLMDPTQMSMYVEQYIGKLKSKSQEANMKVSKSFLDKNKNEKGIVVTPSGLQYLILKDGQGQIAGPNDSVTVNYRLSLTNGTPIDSAGGKPITVLPSRIGIRGWAEALQMMKAGSKWKLFISPELGFGPTPPQGLPIKPNSVIVVEVEMLKVTAGVDPSKVVPVKKVIKKK